MTGRVMSDIESNDYLVMFAALASTPCAVMLISNASLESFHDELIPNFTVIGRH